MVARGGAGDGVRGLGFEEREIEGGWVSEINWREVVEGGEISFSRE